MKDDDLIRNINPFGLRMQPSLRAKVEESAKLNHRSLNAEIVARLEESLQREQTSAGIGFGNDLKQMGYGTTSQAAQAWAENLSQPERRAELVQLLGAILQMLSAKPD